MLKTKTIIRVRYADTDKMQFVYNGKYLEYFEVGRTEMLRSIGLPYKEIEEKGYQLPLLEASIKYKNAGKYDDQLEIESILQENSQPVVHIDYVIRRKGTDDIVAEGFTRHVFIKMDSKRAVRPPKFFLDVITPFLNPAE